MATIIDANHNTTRHNGESKPLVLTYWNVYGGSQFECNVCLGLFRTAVYNCVECDWDVCLSCSKVTHQHPLWKAEMSLKEYPLYSLTSNTRILTHTDPHTHIHTYKHTQTHAKTHQHRHTSTQKYAHIVCPEVR